MPGGYRPKFPIAQFGATENNDIVISPNP